MAEDEELVYELVTENLNNRSVSDATYARAVAKFGEPGVVDLVAVTDRMGTISAAHTGTGGMESDENNSPSMKTPRKRSPVTYCKKQMCRSRIIVVSSLLRLSR